MTEKIRLVVLFGGQSAEHDVSCVSARHVISAADRDRFAVEPVGISRTGQWVIAESVAAALASGASELPATLDAGGTEIVAAHDLAPQTGERVVVFPVLHGPMGEDGTVQGMLELAGLPYVGTGVLGSALCMDKVKAKEMTTAHGIAQAAYLAVEAEDALDDSFIATAESELGYPMFVKPANLGSSVGVSKAADRDELIAALSLAGGYDQWIVVEETIVGREIEVAVLGNRNIQASVPGEIRPGDTFYSYDDKYHDGKAVDVVPADLSDAESTEVRQLAIRAAKALRVEGLSRVDFFYEEGGRGWLLNEINTMPGFTPISMYPKLWEATGKPSTQLVTELVELALERHDRRASHRSVER